MLPEHSSRLPCLCSIPPTDARQTRTDRRTQHARPAHHLAPVYCSVTLSQKNTAKSVEQNVVAEARTCKGLWDGEGPASSHADPGEGRGWPVTRRRLGPDADARGITGHLLAAQHSWMRGETHDVRRDRQLYGVSFM